MFHKKENEPIEKQYHLCEWVYSYAGEYQAKLWLKTLAPFVAFYTSFGWKPNHKIQFWCVDFDSCFKRMNFGRVYTCHAIWNDGKRKILTPWKHQCETSLICFQSDSTKSICFGEKSNLSNTSRFPRSYFIFKKKSECN